MPYAENTTVPADRSRAEIERTLQRYGASAFSYGWDGDRAVVAFRAEQRLIRFEVAMPPLEEFHRTPGGRKQRTDAQAHAAREKAMMQRWRALSLVIKAKLEAVESGITTFEQEFLAHILLPDGTTFGTWAAPQIAQVYEGGEFPEMVPGARPQLTR